MNKALLEVRVTGDYRVVYDPDNLLPIAGLNRTEGRYVILRGWIPPSIDPATVDWVEEVFKSQGLTEGLELPHSDPARKRRWGEFLALPLGGEPVRWHPRWFLQGRPSYTGRLSDQNRASLEEL